MIKENKNLNETKKSSFNNGFVRHRCSLNINFDTDFKFFAIIPTININLHSKEFEIEWLFWGLYIGFNNYV